MKDEELLYFLALQKAKGIGDLNAKKLVKHCGSAQAAFKENKQHLLKIDGIGSFKVKGLSDTSLLKKAEKELHFIKNNSVTVHTFLDKGYPKNLIHCPDGPVLFFQKGNIDYQVKNSISIVGTRNMTNYGKSFLEEFVADIAQYDPLIISGLAYGVDILAHKLALKYHLQTIAVLAHGLNVIYPSKHAKEALNMQENGGLLTDFWSDTKPDRENFIKRNRIVAGLSQATIVIESGVKGGSLITADIASSYNRDVFALPGRVSDTYSKGCNNLIKTNKAAILTSAKDLAYLLNWEDKNSVKPVQKELFVDLDPSEQLIYNYLLKEGKQSLDIIALHCNMPIYKISSILLHLELKTAIRSLPGKLFEAI